MSIAADGALRFIQQILSEQISVISFWRDEELIAWTQVTSGDAPDSIFTAGANIMKIRSWSGTFSRDVRL